MNNYANAASDAPPAPETVIEWAFRELGGNIEGLHDTIDSLERRFDRTLLPRIPITDEASAGGLKVIEHSQSPMQAEINNLKRRVVSANARLSAILSRTEL